MQTYQKHYNTKKTSQRQVIPGREKDMAKNYAGGVVFKLDEWKVLDRFLILGSDQPTYYATAKELTVKNADNIKTLIDNCKTQDTAKKLVDRIVEVSESGRAPNNDPALFALAMVVGFGSDVAKKYALENLTKVARIGTHLFHFAEYVNGFRGWGRGLRNGVAKWYTEKNIDSLALQAVKYQSRDGWSHRDLLRLSHAQATDGIFNLAFAWMTHGVGGERLMKDKSTEKTFPHTIEDVKDIPLIYAFELAKKATTEDEIVALINQYNIPREAIPTQFMGKKVWETLLPKTPMTALIRNLGNLSKHGILESGNFTEINFVVDKITNEDNLRKARIHPVAILMALKTYESGHGMRGSGQWNVVPQIVKALNDAFYLAFKYVEPTGKRILLALDVSGSMSNGGVANILNLSPREASAALALVTMRTEKNHAIIGFTGGDWLSGQSNVAELKVHSGMSLNEITDYTNRLPFGATDCALPAIWAKNNKKDFDAIVIYTDCETWAGKIHPTQAMKQYRDQVGHDVKLIVVGMTSTEFTIADPMDTSALDVVGFDTNVPTIMSDFISDKF